jgi:hypothetical protein
MAKKLTKKQIDLLNSFVLKGKEYDDWEYDVKGYGCERASCTNYLGQDLNLALDEIPSKYKSGSDSSSSIILGVHGLTMSTDGSGDIEDNETIGEIEFCFPE